MWRIQKDFRFEASHQLPDHGGKCARLHGHSFEGTVVCEAAALQEEGPSKGMVLDFADISAALKPLLDEKLDHYHLNDSLGLEHPTCEAIAKWIYDELKPALPSLTAILLQETCTARCEYRPE